MDTGDGHGHAGAPDDRLAVQHCGIDDDAAYAAIAAKVSASGESRTQRSLLPLASALAVGADALVTHDRDFSDLRNLRVLGVQAKNSPG